MAEQSKFPFPAYIECLPYEPLLPDYTPEEELDAVLAKDEVMNIMGARNYYYMCNDLQAVLDNLWVQEPENRKTASLGANWGFYIGWDEISRYVSESWPAAEMGAVSQSVNTPLIYVAFDRKTARGIWYCDGYYCDRKGNTEAVYQKVAVDFIREGDSWKIWHLVSGADIADSLYTDPLPAGHDGLKLLEKWFGTPTVSCTTHDPRYNWNDNYPPEPEAYETFSLRSSYAPEGCPRYRKYLREVKKHAKK